MPGAACAGRSRCYEEPPPAAPAPPPPPGGHSGQPRLLLLLLPPLSACSPAPAAVPEEAPAAPVRLEKLTRETFSPSLSVLGVVRPAETAEVAVPSGGRVRYPPRFADGLATGAQVPAGEGVGRVPLLVTGAGGGG